MSSVGERIKERRLNSGLTLKEVSERIGVKEATVQRYESGVIENIPYSRLRTLAIILKTTPAYLLSITDDPSVNPFTFLALDLGFLEYGKDNLAIKQAEAELIVKARSICGIKEGISDAEFLAARDPQRIKVITDFIERNADILRKSMPNIDGKRLLKEQPSDE